MEIGDTIDTQEQDEASTGRSRRSARSTAPEATESKRGRNGASGRSRRNGNGNGARNSVATRELTDLLSALFASGGPDTACRLIEEDRNAHCLG